MTSTIRTQTVSLRRRENPPLENHVFPIFKMTIFSALFVGKVIFRPVLDQCRCKLASHAGRELVWTILAKSDIRE